MAKNHLEQILEVKSRLRWNSVLPTLRLMHLRFELQKADALSEELLKYFPIATVACIEVHFRRVIQELVDAGPPYSDNIEKLNVPNLKI